MSSGLCFGSAMNDSTSDEKTLVWFDIILSDTDAWNVEKLFYHIFQRFQFHNVMQFLPSESSLVRLKFNSKTLKFARNSSLDLVVIERN